MLTFVTKESAKVVMVQHDDGSEIIVDEGLKTSEATRISTKVVLGSKEDFNELDDVDNFMKGEVDKIQGEENE